MGYYQTFIADNGSNMLKPFKQVAYVNSEDEEFDEIESDLSDTPMEEEEGEEGENFEDRELEHNLAFQSLVQTLKLFCLYASTCYEQI